MVQQLVRLVNPLTALLSGASGLSGGAGQRLEELIQQLTSVSNGLNSSVEAMVDIFGPKGAFQQQEERLVRIETALRTVLRHESETAKAIQEMQAWMSGAA